MNCQGVVDLIDSLPFATDPEQQKAHIEAHTRQCAACYAVLTAAKSLDEQLACFEEPEAPPSLAPTVRALLARQVGATSAVEARPEQGKTSHLVGLSLGVAGVLLALVCQVLILWEQPFVLLLPLSNRLMGTFRHLLDGTPSVLLLALGLMLLFGGLLSRVADSGRPTS